MNRHRQCAARLTKFENGLKGRLVGAGEDTKYCWNYLAGEIYPAYMFLMEYQAKRQNCRSLVLIRENKKCITCMWVNIHVMLGENKYVTCMWVCLGRDFKKEEDPAICQLQASMSCQLKTPKNYIYHWKRNMSLALHVVSMSRWRDVLRLALLHPLLVSKPNGICLSPAVTQNI